MDSWCEPTWPQESPAALEGTREWAIILLRLGRYARYIPVDRHEGAAGTIPLASRASACPVLLPYSALK